MTYDPTDWGDQAIDWVAAAISRYRYNPGYQWPNMTEKQRDWLRGEAGVAIEAVRETEIYALWQVPPGTRTVGWGMTGAQGIEAGTATTPQSGVVHESAVPEGQTPRGSRSSTSQEGSN